MDSSAGSEPGRIWYLQWHGDRLALQHVFQLADDSLEQIRRYRDHGDLIVAATQSGVIGHVQVVGRGTEFELKSIAVVERHRRRGVGSELLHAALRHCRDLGAQRVKVSTSIASFEAIRFYLRHGFRARAIVRDAFLPSAGYRPDAMLDGLPLNDALELEIMLGTPANAAPKGVGT